MSQIIYNVSSMSWDKNELKMACRTKKCADFVKKLLFVVHYMGKYDVKPCQMDTSILQPSKGVIWGVLKTFYIFSFSVWSII